MKNLMQFFGKDSFCDHSSEVIMDTASGLCSGLVSTREKAIGMYHFVRDEVFFYFCPFTDSASDTLKKRRGNCLQKANLLVALLRAAGIAAGYKKQLVSADALRPVLTEEGISIIGDPTLHVWGCVFIDDRWIDADVTFDRHILDFCFEEPWKMKEEWNGLDNRTLPDQYLIGDSSDVFDNLLSEGPLPELSAEIVDMLNTRLIKIR